jgi:lipopolysaccharide export system protein LptA
MKKYIILIFSLLVISVSLSAQTQKKNTIKIMHANTATFEPAKQMQVLTGKVFLIHKGLKMYCDKAYKFSKTNIIKAIGNIHIIQNDTLHMRGDKLTYDGNSRLAIVRKNVILNDKRITLTTDNLNYDANKNIGYYKEFGTVKDSMNVLTSITGQYYANDNLLCFQDSVVVVNPDYTMTSDTLKYTTDTKIIHITGPTNIVGEKDTLYTELGWFNTISKQIELSKNNKAQRESYFCFGDNIFIDNINNTAIIKNNGVLKDTINKFMIKANLIKAFKDIEYAYATDNAHLIQIDNQNDSLFLHADTLSLSKDSTNTILKALHNVKFYKSSLQGICDSMIYSMKDSLATLHNNPIIWANDNQITGDIIRIETGKSSLKKFYVDKNSMIVSEADKDMFNQIKGRNMVGYFKNDFLNYVDVLGSGELLYFPIESGSITAVNKMKCSDIRIYIRNRKLNKIIYKQKPDGTIFPITKIESHELKLKDFRWEEKIQPKSKEDIFKKGNFQEDKKTELEEILKTIR